ncbi:MAG: 1-deoxy-D-xylulose-5-phosphate synthase [Verrucomicrobia bacterium]|nr:1-deoxy-D-xylulose-5-phosphate synthase [Verrucomicrobiota bacterium]
MSRYLDMIDSPRDLAKLQLGQLEALAQEVRDEIIHTVSRTGGHLASNLGVVELTIALHRTFDAPNDKIVWDVSHQTYAHKLITGRRERFRTLRQFGGMSGFAKPAESEYDAFGAGHASTAISAALGLAVARDMRGSDEKVIAVIGDGALTGGTAFEALYQGHSGIRDFLVILNDNKMSISPNVGAISLYLNRVIASPLYNRFSRAIDRLILRIPKVGLRLVRWRYRVLESIKGLLVPGLFFEEMGFRYFGPIDGHDLPSLLRLLGEIKKERRPVLLHVLTRKGKGYAPAEHEPEAFHSAPRFDRRTGRSKSDRTHPTYTEVFGRTLCERAEQDERIVAITAAMAAGVGLDPFQARFPGRFHDVGIAEEHTVIFAAGLAMAGMRPVVAVYSTFLQRAYDQILHDVCLQRLPVVFAVDRAGLVGEDGPTHHGVFDISYLGMMPNMTLLAPKDERELRDMLHFAFQHNGPVAVRYPRSQGVGANLEAPVERIAYGRGVVERQGGDVALLAAGTMIAPALEAAELLAQAGISAMVANPRFLKPLDQDLLLLAASTGRIVTIEEHVLHGGFGSAVAEWLCDRMMHSVACLRIGIPDAFVEHGSRRELLGQLGLTAPAIAARVKALFTQRETAQERTSDKARP